MENYLCNSPLGNFNNRIFMLYGKFFEFKPSGKKNSD